MWKKHRGYMYTEIGPSRKELKVTYLGTKSELTLVTLKAILYIFNEKFPLTSQNEVYGILCNALRPPSPLRKKKIKEMEWFSFFSTS